jgi:hypothetical protein
MHKNNIQHIYIMVYKLFKTRALNILQTFRNSYDND